MVNLFDFDEVDDRHGDVDIDRDVDVVHFVKAERCNLLVVVVLFFKEFWVWREIRVGFTHFHEKKFAVVLVGFVQTV